MAKLMDVGVVEESSVRGMSERACRLLAGLDTGVTGAFLFIAWLLFHSWLVHEFWWAKLNVVAAVFYPQAAFTSGPGVITLTGAAVLLLIYSSLGVIFGIYARRTGVIANLFAAIGFVLVWQAFSDAFVWKRVYIFALSFLTPSATLPGHLLFGLALIRFPWRFRSIALALGDRSWTSGLVCENLKEDIVVAPAAVMTESGDEAAIERMIDEGSPVSPEGSPQDYAGPVHENRNHFDGSNAASGSDDLTMRNETE